MKFLRQVDPAKPNRKSQIAIEYSYAWRDRYPDNHIFWVHASTFDRFEQAYRDIAKRMAIPGTEDAKNYSLTIVRDWLSKPENGSWLFILDNADDLHLFFEEDSSATKPDRPLVSDLLPRNESGSMIITTRDTRTGHRLIDREKVVMVLPLDPVDAEQILRQRVSTSDTLDTESVQGLAEMLGYIPLAISQAAAFIQESIIPIKTYLERLKESDLDLQDYLEEDLPDPRRYPDSENSVIRTWKLSFDQIAKQSPRAAELLSIMVMLDRQAIPRALLKQEGERNVEFDKAVGTLQAYSLIKTEKGGASFEIHRLVYLSTQRWLSLQKRQTEWQEKALEMMVEKFPAGEYGTWEECQSLYLHAKRVAKYNHVHKALLLQRAELISKIARYDDEHGIFEPAYLQNEHALQIRVSELGKKDPATLASMHNLALVLDHQGKYAKAETLYRQTLKLAEQVLGKTHPSTLATMNNLASILRLQGNYTEAPCIARHSSLRQVLARQPSSYLLLSLNIRATILKQRPCFARRSSSRNRCLARHTQTRL